MRLMIGIVLALVFTSAAHGEEIAGSEKLVSYPLSISEDCRDGRAKIYDECGDQLAIYKAAEARAKLENKTLLVSYGAEWCIWCHVFDQYLAGGKDEFTYTYGDESDRERWTMTLMERAKKSVALQARVLRDFAKSRFVLVNIEYKYSPNGSEVVALSGINEAEIAALPFIYTVDSDGRVAAVFNQELVELRRDTTDWYRGYDRVKLLIHLKELDAAARRN